jgi:hypothetical protein
MSSSLALLPQPRTQQLLRYLPPLCARFPALPQHGHEAALSYRQDQGCTVGF